MTGVVNTGLDVILQSLPPAWTREKIGLLTNMAAVTSEIEDPITALFKAGIPLEAILVPEHGLDASVPAGNPVEHSHQSRWTVPIFSLYGAPNDVLSEILPRLNRVLVNLQDVGARFFTYSSTMILLMRAAAAEGVRVTVLDRPNPVNGMVVEGPVLRPEVASFVGSLPVPIRHGLTLGELARFAKETLDIPVALEVIPVRGWHRRMWFDHTQWVWVPPSPNMPYWETTLLYPGTCLVEGTNISEGRGTPYPFHVVGAPWIDGVELAHILNNAKLPGVRFRSVTFTPCTSKYAGETCHGVQIHVMDRSAFRPVRTGVAILQAIQTQYPENFRFLQQNDGSYYFDKLIGNTLVRPQIEAGRSWQEIATSWVEEEQQFLAIKRTYHIYPE